MTKAEQYKFENQVALVESPILERVYLAGAWFTKEQENVIDKLEDVLEAWGVTVFSPRWSSYKIWGGKPPAEHPRVTRQRVFRNDLQAITWSDMVLAVIDDFDPGTIFECGYAFAHNIPVWGYTDVENRGLNLMLSESYHGFSCKEEELKQDLILLRSEGLSYSNVAKWQGRIE
jgi:nucleoside 2-deoxyribosyltransferase